jgi:hypothetical protein
MGVTWIATMVHDELARVLGSKLRKLSGFDKVVAEHSVIVRHSHNITKIYTLKREYLTSYSGALSANVKQSH